MATEIKRLFDIPQYQLEKYNLDKAFVSKSSGEWVATSSKEFIDQVNKISRGLLKLGIKQGDKIAIISSTNRTEWNIMDIGMLQIGVTTIPMYPTISKDEYLTMLK